MKSITGLSGATGEEWYSWPVGRTASALEEVTARFGDNPAATANITASIAGLDARLAEDGALLGGVWAPEVVAGLVLAQWWAGVVPSSAAEELRSARRYERLLAGRAYDKGATVFTQSLTSVMAGDTEAILTIETRADGDGGEAYALARAVLFPVGTDDRVVFESICPVLTALDTFAAFVAAMVPALTISLTD